MDINTRFFQCCLRPTIGWVRLFGRGLLWKYMPDHPLLFSERYGLCKHIKIGNWLIKWLSKSTF